MSFPFLQNYLGLSSGLQTRQAAGGGGAVGGWKEIGRTTLGSAGDTITVSSLANKRYLMIMTDNIPSGSIWQSLRYNSDSGANYSNRYSNNGGADVTSTSLTLSYWGDQVSGTLHGFGIGYTSNLSSSEKLAYSWGVQQNTAGAGTAPGRTEVVGKWANTSNAINAVTNYNQGAGSFDTGSEVVVLGWDPADTHTTNFWEELADVSWTSGSTIDTGTFTAKKYLWVQSYTTSSNTHFTKVHFNGDSGANYSIRLSENGGADGTVVSTSNGLYPLASSGTGNIYKLTFSNYFIINNSSNEKLVIGNCTIVYSTASGSGYAPLREEVVGKWANTSSQINRIQYTNAAGNSFSGGQIKVWGSN